MNEVGSGLLEVFWFIEEKKVVDFRKRMPATRQNKVFAYVGLTVKYEHIGYLRLRG